MAAILLISIVWENLKLPIDGNGISLSAIMKKLKNGCHFININHMEKFQITGPTKFGSPVFRVLMEMKYHSWPL